MSKKSKTLATIEEEQENPVVPVEIHPFQVDVADKNASVVAAVNPAAQSSPKAQNNASSDTDSLEESIFEASIENHATEISPSKFNSFCLKKY